MGTFAYAAPEQLTADGAQGDSRSDVYALGVVLYRVLTGTHPYDVTGAMSDVLRRIADEPPAPIERNQPGLTADLEMVVRKAMAKDPDRRYQSAGDLGADLAHTLRGDPISARADSGWYMLRKTVRRYRVPFAVTTAFILLVAASAIVAGFQAARLNEQKSKLEATLRSSNIDRGRALAASGNMMLAEETLWAEHLAPVTDPDRRSHWALWELYREQPSQARHRLALPATDVRSAAMSADGRWLAVLLHDGLVHVLDAIADRKGSGQVALRRIDVDFNVTASAMHPALPQFALLGAGGARLLDLETGIVTELFRDLERPPVAACWAADGHALVVADTQAVYVWQQGSDGAALLAPTTARPVDLAMSHDGTLIAAGLRDGRVVVIDRATGAADRFLGGRLACEALAFSPDDALLAVREEGTIATLIDLDERRVVARLRDCAGWLTFLAFEPGQVDPYVLAGTGFDHRVLCWEIGPGGSDARLKRVLGGHDARAIGMGYRSDGRSLYSIDVAGGVRIWETAERAGRSTWAEQGSVLDVQVTPDGKHVLTALSSGPAGVKLRGQDGAPLGSVRGQSRPVSGLALDPPGELVAAVGYDGVVSVTAIDSAAGDGAHWERDLSSAEVSTVSWSPDGERIACAGGDGVVWILDAATGADLDRLDLQCQRIPSVRFSPDGRWIAAAIVPRNTIAMIEVVTGAVHEIDAHGDRIRIVRFSAGGTLLASAGDDQVIRLWSMDTAPAIDTVFELRGHRQDIFALAFSPDDALLASSGRAGEIRLWSPVTGRNLVTLPGHDGMVFNLLFHPDGRRLLSASADETIGVWDLQYYDRHIEGNRPRGQ